MLNATRRVFVAAAVLVVLGSLWANEARAQYFVPNRFSVTNYSIPPARLYDPFGYAQQQAYLIGLYGKAMSTVPPYALGYNPYPYYAPMYPPVYPVSPVYPVTPAPYPVNPYFNPYGR